jgi:hypothetical protein
MGELVASMDVKVHEQTRLRQGILSNSLLEDGATVRRVLVYSAGARMTMHHDCGRPTAPPPPSPQPMPTMPPPPPSDDDSDAEHQTDDSDYEFEFEFEDVLTKREPGHSESLGSSREDIELARAISYAISARRRGQARGAR